jgi:hypothetical protein
MTADNHHYGKPDVVEWRDPPRPRGQKDVWIARLLPLMEEPGRWAVVYRTANPRTARTTISGLRHDTTRIPPGKWEFAADTHADPPEVFARYIGPE